MDEMTRLNDPPTIKITISGPPKSGRSTVAQVLVTELESLGDVKEYNDDSRMLTMPELDAKIDSIRNKVQFVVEVVNAR